MSKGRFEVEQLDKGFKVCVYVEKAPKDEASKDGCCMFPEMEKFEAAASSPEEVKSFFDKWLAGEDMAKAAPAEKPKSMLSAGMPPKPAPSGSIY